MISGEVAAESTLPLFDEDVTEYDEYGDGGSTDSWGAPGVTDNMVRCSVCGQNTPEWIPCPICQALSCPTCSYGQLGICENCKNDGYGDEE